MPALVEKTEQELIESLVESVDDSMVTIKLGHDLKGTYVTVSLSSNGSDSLIKPTVEYINSFEDISRIVSNYLTKDVMEFAQIEI